MLEGMGLESGIVLVINSAFSRIKEEQVRKLIIQPKCKCSIVCWAVVSMDSESEIALAFVREGHLAANGGREKGGKEREGERERHKGICWNSVIKKLIFFLWK